MWPVGEGGASHGEQWRVRADVYEVNEQQHRFCSPFNTHIPACLSVHLLPPSPLPPHIYTHTWLFAQVAGLVGAVHVHRAHKPSLVTRLATHLQTGRQGKQAGGRADRQASRQAGRQGKQEHRQAGKGVGEGTRSRTGRQCGNAPMSVWDTRKVVGCCMRPMLWRWSAPLLPPPLHFSMKKQKTAHLGGRKLLEEESHTTAWPGHALQDTASTSGDGAMSWAMSAQPPAPRNLGHAEPPQSNHSSTTHMTHQALGFAACERDSQLLLLLVVLC